MADENADKQDKTEEPTQYRIDEFRKKGEVASSKELTSVILLAGIILCLTLTSAYMFETISAYIEWLYKFEINKVFTQETFQEIVKKSIFMMLKILAPVLITSFLIGYITQFMQFGFIFTTEPLKWDLKKINPIEGFKRLFSMKSVFNAFKGLLKFTIIIILTYWLIVPSLDKFIGFLDSDLSVVLIYSQSIFAKLIYSILLGLLLMAIIDYAWEKYTYKKKLMMTKREAKEELKEREGRPEVKQRIRSIQREMAQKRMMKEIPEADVVVTNPTHISVALKYDREKMVAPIVVAKGADHLALRIREIAKEHDVPMVENVPLARTLYSSTELGEIVPRSVYKTVAEVIAYVYKIKRKKKAVA